jgi:hypothetical protein
LLEDAQGRVPLPQFHQFPEHTAMKNTKKLNISRKFAKALWLMAAIIGFATAAQGAFTRPVPEELLLASAYSGREYLRYDIRWLNTIKAGVLEMEIEPIAPGQERYLIRVTASSAGLLKLLYPVKDSFELIVEGRERLPVSMHQNDSRRQEQSRTIYDQKALQVICNRDGSQPEVYPVDGPVHNEFSSFLILRTLPLLDGGELMVPTFADKKRHEIAIHFKGIERRQSMLGDIATIKIQPQLTFQGLYQKMDNPLIWLTNDANRIPVRIEATIKIGYLTADLAEYRRS